MGWFGDREEQRQIAYEEPHKAKWTHELVSGAASYEAMKAYQEHERRDGQPPNHETAKDLVAGFAGAEVDKLFETRGLDFMDREKTKRSAQQQAVQGYEQEYQGGGQGRGGYGGQGESQGGGYGGQGGYGGGQGGYGGGQEGYGGGQGGYGGGQGGYGGGQGQYGGGGYEGNQSGGGQGRY